MLVRLLALLPFVTGAACAQTLPDTMATDPTGCYRLEHAPWPDSLNHLPNPAGLPDRLELTADPLLVGKSRPDGSVEYVSPPSLDGAHVVRAGGRTDGDFSYWRLADGELFLGRYLPFAGFYLQVRRAGDGWTGTLTGFTDAIPEDGNASTSVSARLVPEPCPQR
jgi:hypothetical protein